MLPNGQRSAHRSHSGDGEEHRGQARQVMAKGGQPSDQTDKGHRREHVARVVDVVRDEDIEEMRDRPEPDETGDGAPPMARIASQATDTTTPPGSDGPTPSPYTDSVRKARNGRVSGWRSVHSDSPQRLKWPARCALAP